METRNERSGNSLWMGYKVKYVNEGMCECIYVIYIDHIYIYIWSIYIYNHRVQLLTARSNCFSLWLCDDENKDIDIIFLVKSI